MENSIKLDIISDVVCPWCVIGYKRLEAAIIELGLQNRIEIEWQPFELNPDMPAQGEDLRAHVARKYGASADESAKARENIARLGAEHGFMFHYSDEMKMVNTRDAHVLLEYARTVGKQTDLKLRLFDAFFSEHKDISNQDLLIAQAVLVGLDKTRALEYLTDPKPRAHIREKEAYWHQLGISGVPTVIFNHSKALTGAQPVDVYKQVLTELTQASVTQAQETE
jgi:predicted DsbA family dithiol-disulfide isomerase